MVTLTNTFNCLHLRDNETPRISSILQLALTQLVTKLYLLYSISSVEGNLVRQY